MARRTARGFYSVRARHHEAAARKAKSAHDREGHLEVARGYHKLSRGKSSGTTHKRRSHKRTHRRSHKKGKRY